MKLWFIIELLLFFVLLAFASARTVVRQANAETPVAEAVAAAVTAALPDALEAEVTTIAPVAPDASEAVENITDANSPSRFCKCVKLECDCCRDFRLPVLPISSAGCASLQYLKGDKMALTMRLGGVVLRNVTISGRKNKPACVNLPGGFSQFCGRVYGISRQEETFRACLGLELRALADLEASLRVSCFRFSPTGVTMEPAPPLPPNPVKEDEDDDDDFFGFGGLGGDEDDDEDEDDDDDEGGIFGDDDEEYKDNDPAENDVSDEDYPGLLGTFGSFFGTFFEETETTGNKKKKKPITIKNQVANDKIDLIVEEKPEIIKKPTESVTVKPNKISVTTERLPTTIVLSPTSSVKVTMSESTTKRAEVPDPIKQSEETKEEEDSEEDDEEEDDDDDDDYDIELEDDSETTEGTDSESFSSELAEAIKVVEEEVSSIADIEIEDASDEDESTSKPGKPSAVVEVSSTTESEDEDIDILGAVEELAEEVSGSDKDEPPPQIGVAMNGEPRGNATKEAEKKQKIAQNILKRTHRVSRHHA